jgi:Flp pilus assembly protein TadD
MRLMKASRPLLVLFGILFLLVFAGARSRPKPPVWDEDWRKGMDLYKASRFEEALPYFKKVSAALPNDFAAQSMLGKCLMNAGDSASALEPLERAWLLKPDDGETAVRVATLYVGLKRYDEALRRIRSHPPAGYPQEFRGDLHRLEGLASWNLKDIPAAVEAFRRADAAYAVPGTGGGDRDARRAEVLSGLVKLQNLQARGLAGREREARYAESLGRAEVLITLDPSSDNLLGAAEAALGSRKYARAEECARKAAAKVPGNGFPLFYLGQALNQQKRFAEAVKPLQDAVRLLPAEQRRAAGNQLGMALEHLGRADQALEAYRQAGNAEGEKRVSSHRKDPAPPSGTAAPAP